jgi:hypothetical protein
MAWHAQLALDYRVEADRTVVRHTHNGPLRVLQSLYPEGDAVCHNVMVHPPGGLVGGDTLDITVQVHSTAHGLITTPGATRFYRSDGPAARQNTHLTLEPGARLEWLPLETLCYSACVAENHLTLDVAPTAELMGWDITPLWWAPCSSTSNCPASGWSAAGWTPATRACSTARQGWPGIVAWQPCSLSAEHPSRGRVASRRSTVHARSSTPMHWRAPPV